MRAKNLALCFLVCFACAAPVKSIREPEKDEAWAFQQEQPISRSLVIQADTGTPLAEIDTDTGKVKLYAPANEAAKQFWKAVAVEGFQVCQREIEKARERGKKEAWCKSYKQGEIVDWDCGPIPARSGKQ